MCTAVSTCVLCDKLYMQHSGRYAKGHDAQLLPAHGALELFSLQQQHSKVDKHFLDRLDLRYTFPRTHYFPELGKVPGS